MDGAAPVDAAGKGGLDKAARTAGAVFPPIKLPGKSVQGMDAGYGA